MENFVKAKIELSYEISVESINELIATAFEGGINYWCGKVDEVYNRFGHLGVDPENEKLIKYKSDVIGYGGTLILYDIDGDDKWYLTKDRMINGIVMHCETTNRTPNELMNNYDAGDADCIVQYALFNEIIFG